MRLVYSKDGMNYFEGDKVRGSFTDTFVGTSRTTTVEVEGIIKFFPHKTRYYIESNIGIFNINRFDKLEKING